MLAPFQNAAQNVVGCWSDTTYPEATHCSCIQFITISTPTQKTEEKLHMEKNPREVVNVTNKIFFFFLGLALFAENVSKLRDVGDNLGIIKGFQPWFSVHQTSCLSSN